MSGGHYFCLKFSRKTLDKLPGLPATNWRFALMSDFKLNVQQYGVPFMQVDYEDIYIPHQVVIKEGHRAVFDIPWKV